FQFRSSVQFVVLLKIASSPTDHSMSYFADLLFSNDGTISFISYAGKICQTVYISKDIGGPVARGTLTSARREYSASISLVLNKE
ncbi:unnamed protein product, partial [Porites lobata]